MKNENLETLLFSQKDKKQSITSFPRPMTNKQERKSMDLKFFNDFQKSLNNKNNNTNEELTEEISNIPFPFPDYNQNSVTNSFASSFRNTQGALSSNKGPSSNKIHRPPLPSQNRLSARKILEFSSGKSKRDISQRGLKFADIAKWNSDNTIIEEENEYYSKFKFPQVQAPSVEMTNSFTKSNNSLVNSGKSSNNRFSSQKKSMPYSLIQSTNNIKQIQRENFLIVRQKELEFSIQTEKQNNRQLRSELDEQKLEAIDFKNQAAELQEKVQLLQGKYSDTTEIEILRDRNLHHAKIQLKKLKNQLVMKDQIMTNMKQQSQSYGQMMVNKEKAMNDVIQELQSNYTKEQLLTRKSTNEIEQLKTFIRQQESRVDIDLREYQIKLVEMNKIIQLKDSQIQKMENTINQIKEMSGMAIKRENVLQQKLINEKKNHHNTKNLLQAIKEETSLKTNQKQNNLHKAEEKLQAQRKTFKSQIEAQSLQIATLQANISVMKAVKDKPKRKKFKNKEVNCDLKVDNSEIQEENSQLKEEIQNLQTDNEGLSNELMALESRMIQEVKPNEQFIETSENLLLQIEQKNEELEEMQEIIFQLKEQQQNQGEFSNLDYDQTIQKQNQENFSLQNKVRELMKAKKSLQDDVLNREKNLLIQARKYKQLEAKKEELFRQLQLLQKKASLDVAKIHEMQSKLAVRNNKIEQQAQTIKRFKQIEGKITESQQELTRKLSGKEKKINQQKEAVQSMKERFQLIQNDIQEKDLEIKNLIDLMKSRDKIDDEQNLKSSRNFQLQLIELQSELQNQIYINSKQKEDISQLNLKLKDDKKYLKARGKLKDLESLLSSKDKKNIELYQEVKDLRKSITELSSTMETLVEKNSISDQNLKLVQKQIQHHLESKATYKHNITEKTKQIAQLETKLKFKDLKLQEKTITRKYVPKVQFRYQSTQTTENENRVKQLKTKTITQRNKFKITQKTQRAKIDSLQNKNNELLSLLDQLKTEFVISNNQNSINKQKIQLLNKTLNQIFKQPQQENEDPNSFFQSQVTNKIIPPFHSQENVFKNNLMSLQPEQISPQETLDLVMGILKKVPQNESLRREFTGNQEFNRVVEGYMSLTKGDGTFN